MKIVINKCWGGYGLSRAAYDFMGLEWDGYCYAFSTDRSNPQLINCIETIGAEISSGSMSKLKIVEIPDEVEYCIHDCDGMEQIHERHNSWS